MQGRKILVVDDDINVRRIAEQLFRRAGGEVFLAADALEGLRLFYTERPDLVILDIMMPHMDGFEACRQIRQRSNIPIILLTALHEDEQIIRGLDSGADDFVTKPFSHQVLLARARALLRRSELPAPAEKPLIYQDSYLVVDLDKHRVFVQEQPVKLTPTEFRLLAYLVRNAGRVLTFHQILENVWGWEYKDSVDYVHVYVSHIRQKIEPDQRNPRYLITEHGTGYRFEDLKGN